MFHVRNREEELLMHKPEELHQNGIIESEQMEEDPRFKICNREALILGLLAVVFFLTSIVVGQVLGHVSADNLTLVAGLPGWFYYSVFLIPVCFMVLVAFIIKFFFTDMPLD
jgi:uncharacterized membrane protein YhdT